MLRAFTVFLLFCTQSPAFAQLESAPAAASGEPAPAAEIPSTHAPADVVPAVRPQVANRATKTVTLGGSYGLYSFLVPSKKGAYLTYLHNDRWTFEADYFSGDWGLKKYGINLVSLTERLTTLRVRKYWNSSFNLTFGLGERRTAFELGSVILEQIPSEVRRDEVLIEIKRTILTFGLGNRWHFSKGFTVGADWIEVAAPVGKARVNAGIVDDIRDENTRKNTRKVLDYLQNLPTINVVKASLGYSF